MENHALAILKDSDSWNWSNTKRIHELGVHFGKLETVTPQLLYFLITESQQLGGEVLDQFWYQLGTCDKTLKENIDNLKLTPFVSLEQSLEVLFKGLDREKIDLSPMLKMAAQYFTHLGIAFMNPGGGKSGSDTALSVGELVGRETDELLELVNDDRERKETLKALSFKRDGTACLLAQMGFRPFDAVGIHAALAHIIPNSAHGKLDTLKCIAMFGGSAARDDVILHLNDIGNAMNLGLDAYASFYDLEWGIEAKEEGGQVKYFFRRVPTVLHERGPGFIRLMDGDEMKFGQGPDGDRLKKGPLARLCNLQLAIARVLRMSAAADIILDWKDNADDDGLPQVFIPSEQFCDILDARILLSGRPSDYI